MLTARCNGRTGGAGWLRLGAMGDGDRKKRPADRPVQLWRFPETVRSGGKPDGPARPAEMHGPNDRFRSREGGVGCQQSPFWTRKAGKWTVRSMDKRLMDQADQKIRFASRFRRNARSSQTRQGSGNL